MGLFDLFKPKKQHSNLEISKKAVEKLNDKSLAQINIDTLIETMQKDENRSDWNPPALALPDEYERRCLTSEFHEETEERTFRSDSAFVDVLASLNSMRFDDAIRHGTKLLPRFRDFDLPWDWVSSAYQETGQLDTAYKVAREGLTRARRKSVLLTRLGDIEWQRGNLPEAVYALSNVLHCYADHPLDYNSYLLLSYIAEGSGLSSVAAAFLRQVDRLRGGKPRLPATLADRLKELSRRSQAPAISRVLDGLFVRYIAGREAAGDGQRHAEPETADKMLGQREKPRTIGEIFDSIMCDAHRKMNDDECQQLSNALVAICTSEFSAAEIQKALNHPSLSVRAECKTFIKTILVEENKQ